MTRWDYPTLKKRATGQGKLGVKQVNTADWQFPWLQSLSLMLLQSRNWAGLQSKKTSAESSITCVEMTRQIWHLVPNCYWLCNFICLALESNSVSSGSFLKFQHQCCWLRNLFSSSQQALPVYQVTTLFCLEELVNTRVDLTQWLLQQQHWLFLQRQAAGAEGCMITVGEPARALFPLVSATALCVIPA